LGSILSVSFNWLLFTRADYTLVAFDVVGKFTLNRHLGFLEQGTDIDNMLQELHEEFTYRALVGSMPWMDKVLAKNPIYLWLKSPNNKFIKRSKNLIMERLSDKKHTIHNDFVDRFLDAKKAHPDIVTPPVLAGYVATNLLAGSDTTAVVMRSVLYYVLKTPGVLQRLRDELDMSGTEYPVPFKTAQKLPYLDAVIREAMRIHFIGSILLERVVPTQGFELPSGQRLAPGTVIGMNPWTLHFDESIFGKDTESFIPDRWLPQEGESDDLYQKRFALMKHNDFSFSYGPRVCLGRHIATLEIYKIMPTMFGLLDVSITNAFNNSTHVLTFVPADEVCRSKQGMES
jgi:cytochrome P450